MEARFTAKQVWDVRAARALLHIVQKTPLWKIGAACAILGAALLAFCLALDMKALGWICFAGMALIGFLLPAVLTLLFAAPMRKKGWIKENDLNLDL